MGKLFESLDRQLHIREPHRRFLKRRLPQNLGYSYCFGGMAFAFFIVLACTGLLLSLHYVPSEQEAFRSVVRITEEVTLGRFVRGLHKWSASLLIVSLLLHTIRVFLSRAYRPPRELNWMAGVLGLSLVMVSGFTGYLLPWDQKAYWATEVGTSLFGTMPLIGERLLYLVRGGPEVGGPTLIRFYSIHVLYMPALISLVLWAHFHMVKRHGITSGL